MNKWKMHNKYYRCRVSILCGARLQIDGRNLRLFIIVNVLCHLPNLCTQKKDDKKHVFTRFNLNLPA